MMQNQSPVHPKSKQFCLSQRLRGGATGESLVSRIVGLIGNLNGTILLTSEWRGVDAAVVDAAAAAVAAADVAGAAAAAVAAAAVAAARHGDVAASAKGQTQIKAPASIVPLAGAQPC